MPKTMNLMALRTVLVLAAAFALFSGLDQALGGLRTLGWMQQPDFFDVTDAAAFLVVDNHQRFLGGVWTGLGAMLLLAATNPHEHAAAIKLVAGVVFLGGLARFSQLNLEVTFGPDILGALVVELLGMPVLFAWVSRSAPSREVASVRLDLDSRGA